MGNGFFSLLSFGSGLAKDVICPVASRGGAVFASVVSSSDSSAFIGATLPSTSSFGDAGLSLFEINRALWKSACSTTTSSFGSWAVISGTGEESGTFSTDSVDFSELECKLSEIFVSSAAAATTGVTD
ncbi:MAG: hypothetical protein OEL83_10545 [Desulforhopalus sp.]|nr:hypothetical protein [Desulforhopalus sp.]